LGEGVHSPGREIDHYQFNGYGNETGGAKSSSESQQSVVARCE